MKTVLRPTSRRYRSWMLRRENELCLRATDRVTRPFEYGLEWSNNWPFAASCSPETASPAEFLKCFNRTAIAASHDFFGYRSPHTFELRDSWLHFLSPVTTPYQENNLVRALWFPAKAATRRAVVVLPHWNSKGARPAKEARNRALHF